MKQKDRNELTELATPTVSVPEVAGKPLGERINQEVVDKLFDKDRVIGYSTGYSGLDAIVGGLKAGSLTIIGAGTSGMGKSVFGINLLVNLNREFNLPVCYIDLENGVLESLERIVKIWHGDDLPENFFRGDYKEDVLKMSKDFKTFSYFSHEDIGASSRQKILKLVNYHANLGFKVFLIDPLEVIPSEDGDVDQMREESLVVKNLKDLAQEKGLVILLLHHIRKVQSGGDAFIKSINDVEPPKMRIPVMDDFKGLGKTTDLATGVWVIVRMTASKNEREKSKTLLRVLKNRFGDLGDVYLQYQAKTLRFVELTRNMETEAIVEELNSPLFEGQNA